MEEAQVIFKQPPFNLTYIDLPCNYFGGTYERILIRLKEVYLIVDIEIVAK